MSPRKIVLYIATSLDGYIATTDESLDWLFNVESDGDAGYSQFYETIDTILMGRKTYDWMMEAEAGNFPYKNKDCYVFSNSVSGRNEHIQYVNEDIVEFTNMLKDTEGKNIWIVGGGELLHFFMKERLVDEFIITIAPVIIGAGLPLFKESHIESQLRLIEFKRFNQFAQLHYVKK